MKKSLLVLAFGALFFCTTANAIDGNTPDGKTSFASNGCTMCHDMNMEKMGPSLMSIRMSYTTDEDALVDFLQGNASARVEPAKAAIMQPQLGKIRGLYADEVRALARYILGIENFKFD